MTPASCELYSPQLHLCSRITGYLEETGKDGNRESVESIGYLELVSTAFLKAVVWEGNGKRTGEDDEVKQLTKCVAPLWSNSIHLRGSPDQPDGLG